MVERMNQGPVTEELRFHFLKLLERNPGMTQREIAETLDLSLGKVNYCVKALVAQGWVKVRNFKNSRNKAAYLYALTPAGLEEKARVTYRFLRRKLEEVEALRAEIEMVREDVRRTIQQDSDPDSHGS